MGTIASIFCQLIKVFKMFISFYCDVAYYIVVIFFNFLHIAFVRTSIVVMSKLITKQVFPFSVSYFLLWTSTFFKKVELEISKQNEAWKDDHSQEGKTLKEFTNSYGAALTILPVFIHNKHQPPVYKHLKKPCICEQRKFFNL